MVRPSPQRALNFNFSSEIDESKKSKLTVNHRPHFEADSKISKLIITLVSQGSVLLQR